MKTKNCIFCGKPATAWCGHVAKGKIAVTAGMCKKCSDKPFAPGNLPLPRLTHLHAPPIDKWRAEHGLIKE